MKIIGNVFFVFLTIVALGLIVGALNGGWKPAPITSITINEKYPLPWLTPTREETYSISTKLASSGLRNCGEYYIRPSRTNKDYLIACTADGKYWNFYILNSSLEIIEASYDSTIKNP